MAGPEPNGHDHWLASMTSNSMANILDSHSTGEGVQVSLGEWVLNPSTLPFTHLDYHAKVDAKVEKRAEDVKNYIAKLLIRTA